MDEQCGELVRDLICVVAMKLQGSLVALLLRKTSGDKGPAIVQVGAREGRGGAGQGVKRCSRGNIVAYCKAWPQ